MREHTVDEQRRIERRISRMPLEQARRPLLWRLYRWIMGYY